MGIKTCIYCLSSKVTQKPRHVKETGVCVATKCVAKAFLKLAEEDLLTVEEADWLADYTGPRGECAKCHDLLFWDTHHNHKCECPECQVMEPGKTIRTDQEGRCIQCNRMVWTP